MEIFKYKKTYYYLILGILSTVISLLMGIDDNLIAISLLFVGAIFLVIAFSYRFKKSNSFLILIFSSIGGLIVFSILHNVFEALEENIFLKSIGVFFFLLAIIGCPSGIIVGTIGFIVRQIREEKKN